MTALAAGSRLRGCIGESREKERDGGESNREKAKGRKWRGISVLKNKQCDGYIESKSFCRYEMVYQRERMRCYQGGF